MNPIRAVRWWDKQGQSLSCHLLTWLLKGWKSKQDICWRICCKLQNNQVIYTPESSQAIPIIFPWALPWEHQLKASRDACREMWGLLHLTGNLYFWVFLLREAVEQLRGFTEGQAKEGDTEALHGRLWCMRTSHPHELHSLPPIAATRSMAILWWKETHCCVASLVEKKEPILFTW